MSLVFSAIVPHPPILIPRIGKDNISRLKKTVLAYSKLKTELEKKQVTVLIIISPHGPRAHGYFILNYALGYKSNFGEFSDLSTKHEWKSEMALTYRIRAALETKIPFQMVSETNLDYGVSVPLFMLLEPSSKSAILPITYSGLSNKKHYEFGELLAEKIKRSSENIAVIASGDLSHALSKESPAEYSPRGNKFDNKLIELLSAGDDQGIIELDAGLTEDAQECGLRSILILLGVMSNTKKTPHILS
ncbi:AmmeMemoRadiSam system protein B, partial [bacterium]|nr:AmmeMemoRadiSam system protein B [bacterium]